MRIPIILMLLVVFLLPADVRSFANDVAAQVRTAGITVGELLDRSNDEDVAPVTTKLASLR